MILIFQSKEFTYIFVRSNGKNLYFRHSCEKLIIAPALKSWRALLVLGPPHTSSASILGVLPSVMHQDCCCIFCVGKKVHQFEVTAIFNKLAAAVPHPPWHLRLLLTGQVHTAGGFKPLYFWIAWEELGQKKCEWKKARQAQIQHGL